MSSKTSLGPQNHHGITAGTTRPRAKSINTDHTQFQDKYQLKPDEHYTPSPNTEALDQIMSSLSQSSHQGPVHQLRSHQHHHHNQQHKHLTTEIHGGSAVAGADLNEHDALLDRSHSQTTMVGSPQNSTTATDGSLPGDRYDVPATQPGHHTSLHGSGSHVNSNNYSNHHSSNNINSNSPLGGSHSNVAQASTSSNGPTNSNSSLNTLLGASPSQQRFFPLSVTSDSHADQSMSSVSGFSSAGADPNPSEHPGEPISTAQKPSLFRSLSTQTGRKQLMTSEKPVGSLPTMQHQSGRGR
ncbi:hypothetical protein BGZ94_004985, partial [Podila epigama]